MKEPVIFARTLTYVNRSDQSSSTRCHALAGLSRRSVRHRIDARKEHPRVPQKHPVHRDPDAAGVPARGPCPRRRGHHRDRLLQAHRRLDHRQHPLRAHRWRVDRGARRDDGQRLHRLGTARPSTSAPPPACRSSSTTAPAPGTTTRAATTPSAPATSPSPAGSTGTGNPCGGQPTPHDAATHRQHRHRLLLHRRQDLAGGEHPLRAAGERLDHGARRRP